MEEFEIGNIGLVLWAWKGSIIIFGRESVLPLLLLGLGLGLGGRGLFDDVVVVPSGLKLGGLPSSLVYHPFLLLIVLVPAFVMAGVDQSHDLLMLQLVQSQLLLLLLEDELLPLELALQILPLPLKSPDLLVALPLDVCPLVLELLDLFLELADHVLVDFLVVGFFLLEFGLNLANLLLLDDVLLVQFPDLFFLVVDGLDLLLGLLGQLLELLLHPRYFIGSLPVLVALEGLLLGLPDLLQGLLLLFEGLQLPFEVLELVFLFDDFVYVVLAVEVAPEFVDLCLVLLDADLLVLEFLLELNDAFVLLHLGGHLLLLFAFPLLLRDFVHLGGEFLELGLELDVLLDQFVLAG